MHRRLVNRSVGFARGCSQRSSPGARNSKRHRHVAFDPDFPNVVVAVDFAARFALKVLAVLNVDFLTTVPRRRDVSTSSLNPRTDRSRADLRVDTSSDVGLLWSSTNSTGGDFNLL